MAIAAPVLFIVAAIASILTIWRSLRVAFPAMRTLHSQVAECSAERSIIVSTLQTRDPLPQDERDTKPLRRRGRQKAKPVTHRLHQFAKAAHAA